MKLLNNVLAIAVISNLAIAGNFASIKDGVVTASDGSGNSVSIGNTDVQIGSQGGSMIEDSGKMESKSCPIKKFSSLNMKSIANLEVKVGKKLSCKINADKNIIKLINFNVDDGELVIDSEGSFSTQNEIKIVIGTPSLRGLKSNGASDIQVSGLKEKLFKIKMNGSGTLKGSGTVANLEVKSNGSAEIDLTSLKATNALIDAKGASEIKVFVTGSLNGKAGDSAEITYKGNPKSVKKKVTGAGDLINDDE